MFSHVCSCISQVCCCFSLISCFTHPRFWVVLRNPRFYENANSGAPGQWKVSDGTVAKPVREAKSSPPDRWLGQNGSAFAGFQVPGVFQEGGNYRKSHGWLLVAFVVFFTFIYYGWLAASGICFFWTFIYTYTFYETNSLPPENRIFCCKRKVNFPSIAFAGATR